MRQQETGMTDKLPQPLFEWEAAYFVAFSGPEEAVVHGPNIMQEVWQGKPRVGVGQPVTAKIEALTWSVFSGTEQIFRFCSVAVSICAVYADILD